MIDIYEIVGARPAEEARALGVGIRGISGSGSDERRGAVTARVALSWSSGKDSALALWTLRAEQHVEPAALITTITEGYERVSTQRVLCASVHRVCVTRTSSWR